MLATVTPSAPSDRPATPTGHVGLAIRPDASPGSPAAIAGLRLRLAGPDEIRARSGGEVTAPATLDAVTGAPVPGGLNDEAIFGALRAWRCGCPNGGPPGPRRRACPRCGAPVGDGPGQRDRLGHVALAAPCVHPWFARGAPSPLALLLDCSAAGLAAVLAGAAPLVTRVDPAVLRAALAAGAPDAALARTLAGLRPGRVLRPAEHARLAERWPGLLTAGHGGRAVHAALAGLDLAAEIAGVTATLAAAPAERAGHLRRRLTLLTGMRRAGVRPEWTVLTVLPVLPPALRPTLLQPGGRIVACDRNALYVRVIRANERVRRLLARGAPELVVAVAERGLQAAVDDLFGGDQAAEEATRPARRRPLAGLGAALAGKRGRFRRHLLGKRVDYSGRAVIVAGPELRLGEVGLPRALALELCRPFVARWLLERGHVASLRAANRLITRAAPVVWDGLDAALAGRLVLLNRAPTLHRPSLQAFAPMLVDGHCIRLHPLVCAGFNADFDGDGMAVHLPLSEAAQREARERLWSARQLLSPANGEPLVAPSKDVALGCYYLTTAEVGARGEGKSFADAAEAALAYDLGRVDLRALVTVRVPAHIDVDTPARHLVVETTVGRCLFNAALPPGLRWRAGLTDGPMDKGALKRLLAVAFDEGGPGLMAEVADTLKDLGFRWATRSGVTLSAFDVPQADIADIVADADRQVALLDDRQARGLLTPAERETAVVAIWQGAMPGVLAAVRAALDGDGDGDLALMARSGARGDPTQLAQLCGMRGLMVGPTGRVISRPVRSNFRQGLTLAEYWTAAPGARKGRGDTALNTARAGYLARRLVAAAQDVVVAEEDCGTTDGQWLARGEAGAAEFARRLRGRVLADPVVDPRDGAPVPAGALLDGALAARLAEAGVAAVRVRSPLTCAATDGLCRRCYGQDNATSELVELGAAVGVVAAQSVGEPGTQLTLRTVHAGGVAAGDDIVAGLPRVDELFEARRPRGAAPLAPRDGAIRLGRDGGDHVVVAVMDSDGRKHRVSLPGGRAPLAADGAAVAAGAPLAAGPLDPRELAAVRGLAAAQAYLLGGIQAVYVGQGVAIDDRHVEVLLRQMGRLARVTEPGDADLPAGALVERTTLGAVNDRVLAQGGAPALAEAALVGVSEAALTGDGWLAAAAFGATERVLATAALSGRVDRLRGLQEHVLLGRRIPAGTGFAAPARPANGRGGDHGPMA